MPQRNNTLPTEQAYLAYSNENLKTRIDNYNTVRKDSSTFSNNTWVGLATSIATSNLASKYAVNCLNLVSNYSYIESPLGMTLVSRHKQGDINITDWYGVTGGEFSFEAETDQIANIELSDSDFRQIDRGIFKILRNKDTLNTVFYWLNNIGVWEKRQPYSNYYNENGSVNTQKDTLQEYSFKGDIFNFVVWKNILYICSGKEEFRSSRGKINGLMKWDGVTWDSIDTGNAGKLKLPNTYVDRAIFDNDPNIVDYPGKNYQYNDDRKFNPSLLQIYKDRIAISGSDVNGLQVKLSEWNNPDNFVDNVLGFTTKPLTSADSARPSSFIIPNGSDKINSLNIFNDVLYIGTNKTFYQYQLVQQNIGGNVQFQLDALQTNNTTNAGTINQQSVITNQNKLYFISDYQTIPEFSGFQIENTTLGGKPYATYSKFSTIIDDTMSKLDFSKATIGVYADKLLIGCKTQNNSLNNNLTLLVTPFLVATNKIDWSYVILDYIQPTVFFQNNRGCYFLNSDDGEMYKITPSKLGVEVRSFDNETRESVVTTEIPSSVWQTGWTGYDARKVTATSVKQLEEFIISGHFASGTKLVVTLIGEAGCGESVDGLYKSFSHIFESSSEAEGIGNSIDALIHRDINNRNGAKYYIQRFKFNYGADLIKYKKLSVKIAIENSNYFLIEEFYGVVTSIENGVNDVTRVVFG